MKKKIMLILLGVSLVFTAFVSSCSNSVSKADYDKLNQEATDLREKKAEAGSYALFLDLLMYPMFSDQKDVQTRYTFKDMNEWSQAVNNMATSLNDDKLNSLITKMQNNQATPATLISYVIQHIEDTTK